MSTITEMTNEEALTAWESKKTGTFTFTADAIVEDADELKVCAEFLAIFEGFENNISRRIAMYKSNDPRVNWKKAFIIDGSVFNLFECNTGNGVYYTLNLESLSSMIHNGPRRVIVIDETCRTINFTDAAFGRDACEQMSIECAGVGHLIVAFN